MQMKMVKNGSSDNRLSLKREKNDSGRQTRGQKLKYVCKQLLVGVHFGKYGAPFDGCTETKCRAERRTKKIKNRGHAKS